MPTEQELNRAKELLAIEKERADIKQKQNNLDSESVGLASSLVDSIKEIQGISTKRSTFDTNILKINKDISKEILGQKRGLTSVEAIDKQLLKNKESLNKASKIENALTNSLSSKEQQRVKYANDRASDVLKEKSIQEDLLAAAETGAGFDRKAFESSEKRQAKAEGTLDYHTRLLGPLGQQAVFTRQNADELERQNKIREKEKETIIANEKKLGAFGGILKGISKIPILGDLVDTDKILGAAMDKIKDGGSGVAGLGAGLKEAGSQMLSGLTNPANIALFAFTAMLGALKTMGELILGNNKKITQFEKTMVMSKDEAKNLAGTFADTAGELDDINVTSAAMIHTFMDMSEQFGFMAKFSQDTLATATRLQATTGITAEAAGSLAASSELTVGSFDDQYKNALATSYELQKQTGVQFDMKGILEETSKVTGTVRANLGGNIEEIAKAVTQAKLFGSSLEDVASAGKTLLDFESSISKELEAELLIGRDINLEKARAAALAGDQVTLAQELQREAGSLSEFQNMNVIQQEALSAAMGMTSDQMADILFQQEIQGKTAEDLRAIGKDELANRLEQQTAQEALSASMESAKSALGDMLKFIDPLLQGVAMLASTLSGMVPIIAALGAGFAYIQISQAITSGTLMKNLGLMWKQVAALAAQAAAFAVANPFTALIGLGVAAAVGAYLYSTADDMVSPGGGGGGYGNRTLMGPEGAIALNNKDTVIAGTNLFPKENESINPNSEVSKPQQTIVQQPTVIQQDNSKMEKLLERALNRPDPVIEMSGDRLGTAVGKYAYSIQ
tara:strand:- start:110 stop:2494 length:2385 start_codon:yes stop_codon:yes gene_type:complete